MEQEQVQLPPDWPVLLVFKTLGDQHRLTMLRLMYGQERGVGELAGLIDLAESTVSHHLSKMHGAGLLRLRMAGNQRFYQVNKERLDQFKQDVGHIEVAPEAYAVNRPDTAWIDALDWDEADKKVLSDYAANGKLTQIPTKEKKKLVILRWLATKFQPGIRYTEKQVNAIVSEVHADYATLRRNLVEYGFMRRERGGGNYWLTPEDETV
ncbi:MAG: metalloregulator ArsR/SmtB family transcription factor [Anaerolineae bacterium]|nr:metalloregulator ArsR/SmtB family transcription factor [Anaerolineae bacterium]